MQPDTRKSCAARLKRIEGQVRGLIRMIDEDRYCIDVVTQIQAVIAAARKVEAEILKDHVSHCVEDAIQSGDARIQRRKIDELVATLSRTARK
jgi:DNA-binding FrmR family transcriptional regulator